MKAPAAIRHPDMVSDDHIHWLYLTMVRLPSPISAADLTRATGHILKAEAKREALTALETLGKIRSYKIATRGQRRMDYTTWYEVVTMQPVPEPSPASAPEPEDSEKSFEEWLS